MFNRRLFVLLAVVVLALVAVVPSFAQAIPTPSPVTPVTFTDSTNGTLYILGAVGLGSIFIILFIMNAAPTFVRRITRIGK